MLALDDLRGVIGVVGFEQLVELAVEMGKPAKGARKPSRNLAKKDAKRRSQGAVNNYAGRELRLCQGMNCKQVAQPIGISAGSYSGLENGWYKISLFRILQALGECDAAGRLKRFRDPLVRIFRVLWRASPSLPLPDALLPTAMVQCCGSCLAGPGLYGGKQPAPAFSFPLCTRVRSEKEQP